MVHTGVKVMGHVVHMRRIHAGFGGEKPKKGDETAVGRQRCRLENIMNMDFKETGWVRHEQG